MVEDFPHRAAFHVAAGIHHHHAVAHLGDDAEVVRDEDEREVGFLLDLAQQPQVLRLYGHVERRGGLVGDDDLGLAGDGDGADHALLHAAADLVRVILDPPVGRRDPHLLQAVDRAPHERALVLAGVLVTDRLDQLVADREYRIERGLRILQDHGDALAADLAHLLLGLLEQILAFEPDRALDDAGRGPGLQLQQRQRRHRLARARFADDGERLALPQVEAHPIHRLHRAEAAEAVGMEVFHLQYDVADLTGHASSLRYFFMRTGRMTPALCRRFVNHTGWTADKGKALLPLCLRGDFGYLTSLIVSKCDERPAAGPG